jgi:hypothetical protein
VEYFAKSNYMGKLLLSSSLKLRPNKLDCFVPDSNFKLKFRTNMLEWLSPESTICLSSFLQFLQPMKELCSFSFKICQKSFVEEFLEANDVMKKALRHLA